jgi:thiamine-phosphate pyrophosphorylase
LIAVMARNLAELLRLVLVTDDELLAGRDPVALCAAAVDGGVTAVELRLKQVSPRELLQMARRLVASSRVPVLVNDRVDVALAAGAAGVHLGIDDLPVALARRVVPAGFVIGASVGAEAEIDNGLVADYWGVGPWRSTATKPDAGPALGPEGLRRLVARSQGIPCIAIGGVLAADVGEVRAAGGVGVAVAGGILSAANVAVAARGYSEAVSGKR